MTKKFNFRRWLYRWFGWYQKWQLRREAKQREKLHMEIERRR